MNVDNEIGPDMAPEDEKEAPVILSEGEKYTEEKQAQTLEKQTGKKVREGKSVPKFSFGHFITAAAFFIPFILMFAIFIGNEIYPFGGRSFLFSDMYHQYMPFFQEFVNKIKLGQGIDYSWNVGIGSNFLALYAYYLASPVNWLQFLFPTEHLMEFMSYAVIVKIGLAGLTSFLYLRSRDRARKAGAISYGALACSVLYAMSGFVAAYNWNVMWMDCIVLFPLIVMGLERIVHKGKIGLYVLALGLCIYTNFYLSIMICLFLVLYFIYLFITEKKSFSMVWKFALGSILAGGVAAILLLPVVRALMATDFGDMDFPKKWEAYFSVLDILARHCACITTERALEHWPNIYCGAMVFFMIPLYAINEKIPAKKRFGVLALAGIMLLSFATNVLDYVWHGLNYPDSLPARQSFIYVMIILIACHDCFSRIEGISGRDIVKAYLGAAVFFLFIERFVEVDDFSQWTWLLNLAFVTVYAICLYLFKTKESRSVRMVVACVAFIALIGEAAANMAYTSVGTVDRTAYLKQVNDYRVLYERNAPKEGFVRAEKFTRKTKNDAVLSGFPSASVFSSTMNSKVMDLYTKLGMQHSKVFYGYDGATVFTSALLNVGFMFGDTDEWENELYQIIDEENGLYLYEAKYTLPFGYVAPTGFDLPDGMNDKGVTLQNKLVKELGGYDSMLVREKSTEEGDDVAFTAETDGIYYGYVSKSGTAKIKMTGASEKEQNFKDLKYGVLFYVGSLKKGQEILLTNGDKDDKTPKISVTMYKLNLDIAETALKTLSKQHMTDVKVDNCDVSGHLELEEAGRLILSIPVDDGWKVWVNEVETEATSFGDAFIALDLEPGSYDIRLHYEPSGKKLGILVSIGFILVVALGFAIPKFWKKKEAKPEAA